MEGVWLSAGAQGRLWRRAAAEALCPGKEAHPEGDARQDPLRGAADHAFLLRPCAAARLGLQAPRARAQSVGGACAARGGCPRCGFAGGGCLGSEGGHAASAMRRATPWWARRRKQHAPAPVCCTLQNAVPGRAGGSSCRSQPCWRQGPAPRAPGREDGGQHRQAQEHEIRRAAATHGLQSARAPAQRRAGVLLRRRHLGD